MKPKKYDSRITLLIAIVLVILVGIISQTVSNDSSIISVTTVSAQTSGDPDPTPPKPGDPKPKPEPEPKPGDPDPGPDVPFPFPLPFPPDSTVGLLTYWLFG